MTESASRIPLDGWQRLHPLSPLLRGGLVFIIVIGVVVASLRDRILQLFIAEEYVDFLGPDSADLIDFLVEQRLIVTALLVVLGVAIGIVLLSWLSWRFNTYRITADAVEERSGVLFRQHRQAPLDRVQSVNLHRPLLARLVGLTQVTVQTGGQGGKVSLKYLAHGEARTVRERILHAAAVVQHRSPAGADPAGADPASADTASVNTLRAESLMPRDAAFIDADIDAAALAAGAIVSVPTGRLIGSILCSWDLLLPVALAVMAAVIGSLWAPLLLLLLLPFGLAVIGVAAGQFNRGFRFVLSRGADGVRVGAGLTATVTETLPLSRLHAVEVRQPLVWRLFGWWQIRITTAGYAVSQGGQNRLQNKVLPVGTIIDARRVLDVVLPSGFAALTPDEFVAELAGPAVGYRGAGRRSAWVLWFGRRRAGVRLDAAAVLKIRRGALTRSLSAMSMARAQSVQLRRPLVHRMIGLASVQAHTVLGPVRMEMRGLARADAQALFDELAATAVRVQANEPHSEGAQR